MPTVSDLIHSSMRLIGAIAAGELMETTELNDALVSLNQMLASWSDEQLSVYQIRRDTFTMTGGQTYTMGPAGDFIAPRPTQIVAARASNGNYGRGLRIVDVNRWTEILERGGPINLPMKAFIDYAFPLATVHLWPVPLTSTTVELYVLQEYTTFAEGIASAAPPPPPLHNFQPQRLMYLLGGSIPSFTIGAGGQLQMPRPARCDAIAASTGTYRNQVQIVSAAEWSTLLEPSGSPITIPLEIYIEYSYPALRLNMWPVPAGGTLDIHSLQKLAQFAAITDIVDLPEGYETAIRFNLAIALAPEYGRPIDQTVLANAQQLKGTLVQLNATNQMKSQAPPAALQGAA